MIPEDYDNDSLQRAYSQLGSSKKIKGFVSLRNQL
jgi:hypothetical protein